MRYEAEGGDPANAGLQHARVFLEPVKAKHSWITYADLWTLAGVVAIKETGGPDIEWKGGRTDYVDDSKLPSRGRLPDGAQGADHLRFIFYRMGFNDQEIVALSGAHNLGRCHSDRSYVSSKSRPPFIPECRILISNAEASTARGSTTPPASQTPTTNS